MTEQDLSAPEIESEANFSYDTQEVLDGHAPDPEQALGYAVLSLVTTEQGDDTPGIDTRMARELATVIHPDGPDLHGVMLNRRKAPHARRWNKGSCLEYCDFVVIELLGLEAGEIREHLPVALNRAHTIGFGPSEVTLFRHGVTRESLYERYDPSTEVLPLIPYNPNAVDPGVRKHMRNTVDPRISKRSRQPDDAARRFERWSDEPLTIERAYDYAEFLIFDILDIDLRTEKINLFTLFKNAAEAGIGWTPRNINRTGVTTKSITHELKIRLDENDAVSNPHDTSNYRVLGADEPYETVLDFVKAIANQNGFSVAGAVTEDTINQLHARNICPPWDTFVEDINTARLIQEAEQELVEEAEHTRIRTKLRIEEIHQAIEDGTAPADVLDPYGSNQATLRRFALYQLLRSVSGDPQESLIFARRKDVRAVIDRLMAKYDRDFEDLEQLAHELEIIDDLWPSSPFENATLLVRKDPTSSPTQPLHSDNTKSA